MPANATDLQADADGGTLENRFFRVTLDAARGTVRSLIEKQSGRELVDAAAVHGFGQYLHERFDDSQVQSFVKAYVKISASWASNELGKPNLPPPSQAPYRALTPQNFRLRLARSPVTVAAVMEAGPGLDLSYGVTTRVTLHGELPCVDLEVTLHGKPADPWPEAGWLCLPFRVDHPRFRLGRLGSIIDPATEIVPGCNRHLLALNTGAVVLDGAAAALAFVRWTTRWSAWKRPAAGNTRWTSCRKSQWLM